MNRNVVENKQFDEERSLYNLKNSDVVSCVFAGPADGESVLKEARDINVIDCKFSLRYPMWHVKKFTLEKSSMDELTRAALWITAKLSPRNSAGRVRIFPLKILKLKPNIFSWIARTSP